MLKPQDIVILLKILSLQVLPKRPRAEFLNQKELSILLCMSASEVHEGSKRLLQSQLVGPIFNQDASKKVSLQPIKAACEECLISGVKYFYPAEVSGYTTGIPTSYAAPIFENQLSVGAEPIPVWPHIQGAGRGLALEPLYRSVPDSLIKYPDPIFYDLLALIDAIRGGRAREKNIAIKILRSKLNNGHNE